MARKPCLTPADWVARKISPPDRLLGDLFTTTTRTLLSADTGAGKTMLAMAFAFAMHLKHDFLHWQAHRKARVMYLDGEMPRDLMQERIQIACKWFGVKPPKDGPLFLSREDFGEMPALDTDDGLEWIKRQVDEHEPNFIVFDNIMSLCSSSMKEEDSWQFLKPFVLRLSKLQIGQLWLHHTGHNTTRAYGTKTREWHMDSVIVGEKAPLGLLDVSMNLRFDKARRRKPTNMDDFKTVHITLRDNQWDHGDVAEGAAGRPNESEKVAMRALKIVTDNEEGPVSEKLWSEQAYKLGISKSNDTESKRAAFRRARKSLLAKGLVKLEDDKFEIAA